MRNLSFILIFINIMKLFLEINDFLETYLTLQGVFMKKLGLATILSLGLAFSPLCAVESKKSVAQDLSVADSAFLFSTSANALNVETLSAEEMRKTEGEGVVLTALAVGVAYGAGQEIGKKIKKWFRW